MIVVYKRQGVTPLEAIGELRRRRPDLEKQVLSYAGRLDPMAEGLLLILVGDENKERKQFERLPKEYEFDVIFGIETDSFDLLGMVRSIHPSDLIHVERNIPDMVSHLTGTFDQEYPPYSAARVGGKPLYAWARSGVLPSVMPVKAVTVESLIYIGRAGITGQALLEAVREKVGRVQGNFRQEHILAEWEKSLVPYLSKEFPVMSFRASVSGGTYIRSLAHTMGTTMGYGAVASRIRRTRIGESTEPEYT